MTFCFLRGQIKAVVTIGLVVLASAASALAQDIDKGYCQLTPIRDTRVAFAGREIVREVAVELGQRVERHDVLIRLDPASLPARLERARAELHQAERAMARADALAGVLIPEERDKRETDLAVRRATLLEIELEIQRLTLRAPHGGFIVEILAREGELLESSVAVRIVELSRLLVEADMPLARVASFKKGQILRLNSETGGFADAQISFVDPLVDLASRTFRIRAELDNTLNKHTPGTNCELVE